MTSDRLTVIIPALNEAGFIDATLACVRRVLPRAAVLVVDGGSADDTRAIASRRGATVLESPRGRGVQCHAGALQAVSEWLLFLHADTLLPPDAEAVIRNFVAKPSAQIGTFPVQFAGGGRVLNALAWVASRGDSVFTRFGDQGILVRRGFYAALGGFPPWPLFEDVALFQRARKLTRIHWLPGNITTSARRFRARGIVRQRFLNAQLMLRYLAGASPFELAKRYHSRSAQRPLIEPGANASNGKADASRAATAIR